MSRPIPVSTPGRGPIPPSSFCGHAHGQDVMTKAIQDFVEAIGKVFGHGDGDDEPEEPSSVVTITKRETTYEFDAEGVARAFVKTLGALKTGRWHSSHCKAHEAPEAPAVLDPEDLMSEDCGTCDEINKDKDSGDALKDKLTADALVRAFFSNTASLEGPDGKLKPEILKTVVSAFEGVSSSVAVSIIQSVIPEKHRQEVLEAFKAAAESDRNRQEAARRSRQPKAPDFTARGPAAPAAPVAQDGNFTPGGRRIVCVKELDEEFLKKQFPEQPSDGPDFKKNRFEVHIDVGDHRPAAVFRGATKEEAILRADSSLSISESMHERDEGMAQDDIDYEGDLRDKPPTDV